MKKYPSTQSLKGEHSVILLIYENPGTIMPNHSSFNRVSGIEIKVSYKWSRWIEQDEEEIETGRPEIHIAQIEMGSMNSFDSHIPQFVDRIITWSRLV